MGHTTNRRSITRATLGICALALLCLALASPAQAADEHLFDPVLSLEGDCKAEDGVADPGCTGAPLAYPAGNAPKAFNIPCGTATDPHGSIYVANSGGTNINGVFKTGEVAVFDPQGKFLTKIPTEKGSCKLAVDSQGVVYVWKVETQTSEGKEVASIDRFDPDSYPPSAATTYSFGASFNFILHEEGQAVDLCANLRSIAVDPSNDHLYISHQCYIEEYGSASEGTPLNPLLDCCIGESEVGKGNAGVDVYGGNHDVYVTKRESHSGAFFSTVAIFDGADGELKCTLDGSDTPDGSFSLEARASLAVDQSNGDFYVYDSARNSIMQFGGGGEGCPHFIGELPPSSQPLVFPGLPGLDLAVDAPCRKGPGLAESCDIGTYESPNAGHVFATSGTTANNSHLFAFEAPNITAVPPEVRDQSATAITEDEAVLRAELNPQGLPTTYRFEYTTQAAFEEHGYEDAISVPVPDQSASAGGAFLPVSAAAPGLNADTTYRFRLRASNCEAEGADLEDCLTLGEGDPGGEGEDASFATYPVTPPGLPDGRAYELVTPPDTHGHVPTMTMLGAGFGNVGFASTMASPDGDSLIFGTMTGSLPELGGSGFQDTFEARRGQGGWQSAFTGLSGAQAEKPFPGGASPDHGYAFWSAEGVKGSLLATGPTTYLRVPDGSEPSPNCAVEAEPLDHFEWIGCGSLGFERRAIGNWISPDAEHVIFSTDNGGAGRTAQQLEPCAPPTGVPAIYDRTPGGQTRCVSLLPGDITPTAAADYKGVSADGSAVAFTVAEDDNLYVRRDNAETLVVAEDNAVFGGLSRDGSRAFFFVEESSGLPLHRGELFACDLDEGGCAGEGAHEPVQIGSGAESVLVNVAADGSAVYFVSPVVLTGEEENGHGAKAQAGEENLYAWDGEAVRFVATVSALDVGGEAGPGGQGLGLWASEVLRPSPGETAGPSNDPSRTTPDGDVFVFQSHEDLTGYESEGRIQVYRYDSEAEPGKGLSCLSCNPTGAAAETDARLQMRASGDVQTTPFPPATAAVQIANVTSDGERVFFQSGDRLVSGDIDGFQDVYEWQAQGTGGCEREGGCLSLVSSGRSIEDDYLYAMTPDGSDVFFLSGDTLVPQDPDGTPSIYDARVDGGFPPPTPPPGECLGEACQPTAVAPDDPSPASLSFEGAGNVHEEPATKPRCPKGKRKVRSSNGKVRCVKRHAKKKNRKRDRASHNRRAAR